MATGAVVAHPADKYANATQPWMRYQPRRDTLTAHKPTMAQRIPDMVKDGLRALGLNKFAANAFGTPIADVLGYSPVGAVAQSWDAGQAAARADGGLNKALGLGGGMALAALGAVPGGKALRGAARDAERGIIAYHGSPHTFDRFSLDKIGTGEGAQAYGHGLYFAENEAVARGYRDALTDPAQIPLHLNGKPLDEVWTQGIRDRFPEMYKGLTRASGEDMDALLGTLAQESDPQNIKSVLTSLGHKRFADLYHSRVAPYIGKPDMGAGSMYQVRINADPADFLDWDKPLAEQSDKVRAAAMSADTSRAFNKTRTMLDWFKSGNEQPHNPATGQVLHRALSEYGGAGDDARQYLQSQGIPGIKYLDAGSRGAGDGSRNFVVFNDRLIDILKRYGWVPGTAIPAGLLANAQLLSGGEGIPGREVPTQY